MSSILPIYLVLIFGFLFAGARRAQRNNITSTVESRSIYLLIASFAGWTVVLVIMGLNKTHLELMEDLPLLWQAFVPVTLWMSAITFSRSTRLGLHKIAISTPPHWLSWIQLLRIGALGGIMKGVAGHISSDYVFWIGIPDFVFGISALVVGWLLWKSSLNPRVVIAWNLLGFSLIFFPTFLLMPHWMNETGFSFIFEFPMILAPGIIVPTLISINLMQAWSAWFLSKKST